MQMPARGIHAAWMMAATLGLLLCPAPGMQVGAARALGEQPGAGPMNATRVTTHGRRLVVNGEAFQVRGVGYAPTPIGVDVRYDWPYGDYFTAEHAGIYGRDLPLLREMGANTVRLWGWKYDSQGHGPLRMGTRRTSCSRGRLTTSCGRCGRAGCMCRA